MTPLHAHAQYICIVNAKYQKASVKALVQIDFSMYALSKQKQNKKTETSSPKGNDHSSESNVPRSICPKTLCSLSPTPMMLHIKFDQDWPTGFRDIQVQKCEIFFTQGQVTQMSGLIRPKIKLDRAFMPVLDNSNFDDDSNKNDRASM